MGGYDQCNQLARDRRQNRPSRLLRRLPTQGGTGAMAMVCGSPRGKYAEKYQRLCDSGGGREVTDPFAYFPRERDGGLRDRGPIKRLPVHKIWDALAMGWVPIPPRWVGPYELEVIWCLWIECACGRKMPVPR